MTTTAPPEDRLDELPVLARRALTRVVASIALMPPEDVVWVKTFLAKIVADDERTIQPPDGARDLLLHVAGLTAGLRPDVPVVRGDRHA